MGFREGQQQPRYSQVKQAATDRENLALKAEKIKIFCRHGRYTY